jgi:hypothetical protein
MRGRLHHVRFRSRAGSLSRSKVSDPARPGPTALADDSWDDSPAIDAGTVPPRRPTALRGRHWIALILVLAAVGALASTPFVPGTRPAASVYARPGGSSTYVNEATPVPVENATPVPSSPPMSTGHVVKEAPGANSASPGGSSTAGGTSFTTVTLEAENGVLTGSASILNGYPGASGAKIVYRVGDWDDTSPGTLTLNGIVFPAAANYTMTIYYVNLIPQLPIRAQITVSGTSPFWIDFHDWNVNCCRTAAVTLAVPAGSRSITVGNATGRAPWIDKIVISRA